MVNNTRVKDLFKILIGVAWLDGTVQPEEREYLQQVASEKGVAAEPDIQPLLNESRVVEPTECYKWIEQYLGNQPTQEDCQNLLEAISALIYRDGEVATAEAQLLNELQTSNPTSTTPQHVYSSVVKQVQNLYRRWIDRLD